MTLNSKLEIGAVLVDIRSLLMPTFFIVQDIKRAAIFLLNCDTDEIEEHFLADINTALDRKYMRFATPMEYADALTDRAIDLERQKAAIAAEYRRIMDQLNQYDRMGGGLY